MKIITLSFAACALMLMGCTTTGNVERNAAAGAAVGALAGAVIANNTGDGDATKGATVGAGVGAAGGAVRGYSLDQRQTECNQVPRNPTYRDNNGASYYAVPGTNRTCWSSTGRPRGL